MDNFAAAYQHDPNAARLNELLARNGCREYGRDWDDDLVDDFESGYSSQAIYEDTLEKQQDGSISHSRSSSHAPAPSIGRVRSPSAQGSRSPSLSAYQHIIRKASTRSPRRSASHSRQQAVRSPQTFASSSSAFLTSARSTHEPHHTKTLSDASAYTSDSGSRRLLPSDGGYPSSLNPPRRAYTRSYSSQRSYTTKYPETIPEEKGLQRKLSILSESSTSSYIPPHPAVRPLESRKALGEAAGPSEEDEAEYPAPLSLSLIVLGICLSVFIISLNRNLITTAIPRITERFHSYDDIGWYGSAYLLTASAFQPLYGRIYMSFSTKPSFLVALCVFEAGSLLCALAPSSIALILGRAIQGVGSAGVLTGSFVVGTHSVKLAARPLLFAGVGILYATGALCGPLIGGALTDTIGWRWCFWINLPCGLVAFCSVFFFFRRRTPADKSTHLPLVKRILSLDLIGNIILLGAAVQLFVALQLSEARLSWSSSPVIGCLCGFGVTTLLFIAWCWHRQDAALLPPRIIRQRTVAASCGAAFFIYGAVLVHSYYLPIYFQAIRNASALQSGVDMVPYMVANAVLSLLAGIFVSKNGLFAPPAIIGCMIGTIGCGLLATLNVDTSTAKWVGYMILASAGIGMAIQQGFSAVQTALPLEEVPIGTAAVVASQSAGGAIFVSVGNTLLQNHLLSESAAAQVPGVNLRVIIEMGTTNFRQFVPEAALPTVVKIYAKSLQGVFIAAVPLVGCAFLCSLCMEWRSVRADQEKKIARTVEEKT